MQYFGIILQVYSDLTSLTPLVKKLEQDFGKKLLQSIELCTFVIFTFYFVLWSSNSIIFTFYFVLWILFTLYFTLIYSMHLPEVSLKFAAWDLCTNVLHRNIIIEIIAAIYIYHCCIISENKYLIVD